MAPERDARRMPSPHNRDVVREQVDESQLRVFASELQRACDERSRRIRRFRSARRAGNTAAARTMAKTMTLRLWALINKL